MYQSHYSVPLSYDLTTFYILGQKFVKFFVGLLENLRYQKDILKLIDLWNELNLVHLWQQPIWNSEYTNFFTTSIFNFFEAVGVFDLNQNGQNKMLINMKQIGRFRVQDSLLISDEKDNIG